MAKQEHRKATVEPDLDAPVIETVSLSELEAQAEELEAKRLALRDEAREVARKIALLRHEEQLRARYKVKPADAEALAAIVVKPDPVEVGVTR